jgi:hypothetical protein
MEVPSNNGHVFGAYLPKDLTENPWEYQNNTLAWFVQFSLLFS